MEIVRNMETDNIGGQQPSLSPTKAEDTISDVESHVEAPVSNPLMESLNFITITIPTLSSEVP